MRLGKQLDRLAMTVTALFDGQVTYGAVDLSPRRAPQRVLIGSELDLVYRPLEAFGAAATPPFVVLSTPALIVNGRVNGREVLVGRALVDRAKGGDMPPDALVVDGCSVQAWRAGQLVHPVKKDRVWAEKLLAKWHALHAYTQGLLRLHDCEEGARHPCTFAPDRPDGPAWPPADVDSITR